MKRTKEVKRYAKTFLNMVGMDNAPSAINELNTLNTLMSKSREFKGLILGPQFTAKNRENVLKQISGNLGLSEKTIKFIVHISELGIAGDLHDIIRTVTNLYLEKKRRAKAIVMTPIEIGRDYENRLKESLKKITDRDIDIEVVTDSSLLGGVIVKVGSTMYDSSIKGQLRLLKDELIKG